MSLAPAAAGCKDPGLGKYLGRQFFVSAITVWRPLTRNLGRARIQEFAIGCLSAELRCAPSRSYFDKNPIRLICRMWPIGKWIIVTRSLPRWPGSSSLDSSSHGVPTKGFHSCERLFEKEIWNSCWPSAPNQIFPVFSYFCDRTLFDWLDDRSTMVQVSTIAQLGSRGIYFLLNCPFLWRNGHWQFFFEKEI